jgi:hypothetical protein
MLCLRQHLDLSNTLDSAVWATACLAWCACCRLGELLINNINEFSADHHVSRSCPLRRATAANNHKTISFKIPFSKTKLEAGDWIHLTELPGQIDPISAMVRKQSSHHSRSWLQNWRDYGTSPCWSRPLDCHEARPLVFESFPAVLETS